jgi:hypothetical protein
MITPHFKATDYDPFGGTQWQTLANDLAAALSSWEAHSREVVVKLYDAEASAPNFPKATKTLNLGAFPNSAMPRELALCLSIVCGQGPRRRGRLYLPGPILSPAGQAGLRPNQGMLDKAAALAAPLRALGGANVQWGVFSRTDSAFYQAETAYVDDEWDVIRSRGGQATTRRTAGAGA